MQCVMSLLMREEEEDVKTEKKGMKYFDSKRKNVHVFGPLYFDTLLLPRSIVVII